MATVLFFLIVKPIPGMFLVCIIGASAAAAARYDTAAPIVLPSTAEYAQLLARSDPLWAFDGSSNQYPSLWTEA